MDLSVLPQNHPSLPSAAVQPNRCPQHVPQSPASTAGSPGIPASLQGSARAAPPVQQSLPLLRFVPCQGVFCGHRCPRGGCCSPSARLGSGQQCGMRFQGNRRLPARGCARRRAGVSVLGTPEPGMAAAAQGCCPHTSRRVPAPPGRCDSGCSPGSAIQGLVLFPPLPPSGEGGQAVTELLQHEPRPPEMEGGISHSSPGHVPVTEPAVGGLQPRDSPPGHGR